jgi:hypothetical protein
MELVDWNPATGRKSYVDIDAMTGDTLIIDQYDKAVGRAAIQSAKDLSEVQSSTMGDGCLVATIPPEVQLEWLDKFGIWYLDPNHADGVKRLLNSNEYRYLKVRNIII